MDYFYIAWMFYNSVGLSVWPIFTLLGCSITVWCLGGLFFHRGPARTRENWRVHDNTSCPPSWRANYSPHHISVYTIVIGLSTEMVHTCCVYSCHMEERVRQRCISLCNPFCHQSRLKLSLRHRYLSIKKK